MLTRFHHQYAPHPLRRRPGRYRDLARLAAVGLAIGVVAGASEMHAAFRTDLPQ